MLFSPQHVTLQCRFIPGNNCSFWKIFVESPFQSFSESCHPIKSKLEHSRVPVLRNQARQHNVISIRHVA